MIACKGGKDILGVMNVSHYLHYFERRQGTKLSWEMADKEQPRKGLSWITVAKAGDLTTSGTKNTQEVLRDPQQAWTRQIPSRNVG
jgi:hypothetical protein